MTGRMRNDSDEILQNCQIEKEILKQILVLEGELQEHYALMKNEVILQKDLIARLWILSQRYILLDGAEHLARCAEGNTGVAEDVLLLEFSDKLALIRHSNCRIRSSLSGLRISYIALEGMCAELDSITGSSLTVGGVFHKPVGYFIELISDIIKFLNSWILKLVFSSNQIDPIKISTVEQYKSNTEICTNFEEYFNLSLTYCKCVRLKTY